MCLQHRDPPNFSTLCSYLRCKGPDLLALLVVVNPGPSGGVSWEEKKKEAVEFAWERPPDFIPDDDRF